MQTTRGPNGEDMVLLTRDEYEDLLDARGHEAAMRAVGSGASGENLTLGAWFLGRLWVDS